MAVREEKISVRSLVEFILRSGDIDNMSGTEPLTADAMLQGGKIHRKLQKEGGPDYQAEVPLSCSTQIDDELVLTVSGRADGIITESEIAADDEGVLRLKNSITVDEIKGTYRKLRHITEPVPVHLAQAKCYACFYIAGNETEESDDIYVRMTYVNMESGDIKRFTEKQDRQELLRWYSDLTERYALWVRRRIAWQEARDRSIAGLRFPFEYRQGQKKLISGVYQTIVQRKRLFAMAPTGTGKTIAALYPSVQALGSALAEKIFYLTSKTVTGTVAEDTFRMLRGGGLKIKTVTLTARDKICIFEKAQCSPRLCPRALGHFDRVNDALLDILDNEDDIDRECAERYAQKHNVCPFELQLDISVWSDAVICDYNYVFDPDVALKRFFADRSGEYIFLIDEAHNLVERARNMYSAELSLTQLNEAAASLKGIDKGFSARLSRCRRIMRNMRDEAGGGGSGADEDEAGTQSPEDDREGQTRVTGVPDNLAMALESMNTAAEELLKTDLTAQSRDALTELFFAVRKFMNAYARITDRYICCSLRRGRFFAVRICCEDPSADLGQRLAKGRCALFFSATLIPVRYYKEMLSDTPDDDYDLYVNSPFDRNKRLLFMGSDVSSIYRRRGPDEYARMAEYIHDIIRARRGNYMVFFPSYTLMDEVFNAFSEMYLQASGHGISVIMQRPEMSEDERREFLDAFSDDGSSAVTGFCVMGGIFAEGIDLREDRLIGVAVIGTGLPQVCAQRELLRGYFDGKGFRGFDYAYLYPGMNKVLQAAGRVIRTQSDEGVIALLDERFAYRQYRDLFPREWSDCRKLNIRDASGAVEDFWTERKS